MEKLLSIVKEYLYDDRYSEIELEAFIEEGEKRFFLGNLILQFTLDGDSIYVLEYEAYYACLATLIELGTKDLIATNKLSASIVPYLRDFDVQVAISDVTYNEYNNLIPIKAYLEDIEGCLMEEVELSDGIIFREIYE